MSMVYRATHDFWTKGSLCKFVFLKKRAYVRYYVFILAQALAIVRWDGPAPPVASSTCCPPRERLATNGQATPVGAAP